jgi:ATP-binding cassette subfamily C protein
MTLAGTNRKFGPFRRVGAILHDVYTFAGSRLALLIGLLFFVGIGDGISTALLYPVLESVGLGAASGQGTVGAAFHSAFAFFGIEQNLLNTSLVLVMAAMSQGLLFTAQNWLLTDIQKRYVAAWQRRLFGDFMASEWSYFVSQKTGEMLNLVLVEVPRLGSAFFAILQLINSGFILVVYLSISLFVSWKLTLLLVAVGLVMFMIVRPIRRATRRYGSEFSAINSDFSAALSEMLGGAKFIKTSAGEGKAQALVAESVERVRHNLTWSAFLPTMIRSGFEFAGVLMILSVLVFGLKVEQVSAAQLLVLIALVARLFPRVMQLQIFYNTVNLAAPAFTVVEGTHRRFAERAEMLRGGALANISNIHFADIVGRGVVVRYGQQAVLNGISFTIPAGRVVGFVGPSGAGKSTLLDVVMGLVEPSSGDVSIGPYSLRDIDLAAWRHKIGYVSQDTFLFHDTIANNIRWSTRDATPDAVMKAARAAGLESFVAGLPAGYDTIVGDRGVKLSGGQRQRISIARALIRNPALLILDEATSALDSLSEQEIMNVVNQLTGNMTIVIVAHRLATVREADLIYVLEHGKIVEQGSWAELSNQQALFQRLMQAQVVSGPD